MLSADPHIRAEAQARQVAAGEHGIKGGRPKDGEKTLPVVLREGFSKNGDDVPAEPPPEKAAKKKQARERESAAAS